MGLQDIDLQELKTDTICSNHQIWVTQGSNLWLEKTLLFKIYSTPFFNKNIILYFSACARDGTARLWDCGEAKCLSVVAKCDSPVNSCALGLLTEQMNVETCDTDKGTVCSELESDPGSSAKEERGWGGGGGRRRGAPWVKWPVLTSFPFMFHCGLNRTPITCI